MLAKQQIKYIKFLIQEHETSVQQKTAATITMMSQQLQTGEEQTESVFLYTEDDDALDVIESILSFLQGEADEFRR